MGVGCVRRSSHAQIQVGFATAHDLPRRAGGCGVLAEFVVEEVCVLRVFDAHKNGRGYRLSTAVTFAFS